MWRHFADLLLMLFGFVGTVHLSQPTVTEKNKHKFAIAATSSKNVGMQNTVFEL